MHTTSPVLEGTGVSPGVAIGPVVHMGAPIADLPGPVTGGVPDVEFGRAQRALDEVARDLEQRRDRAEGDAVAVLDALSMLARDPALIDAVGAEVDGGRPAPHAVDAAIAGFRSMLEAAGGYLAERAADLTDLRNRTVARLLHLPMPGVPEHDAPFVLAADDLAPADTVDLRPGHILAIVTSRGGPTSHTAIIAKAMGLPCIVGCHGIAAVADETVVIVDGSAGRVTVDPHDEEVAAAKRRRAARETLLATSAGPGVTADGHRVQLLLNIGSAAAGAADEVDAEGVGLLRTEFLFLDRGTEPTVEEQTASYQEIFAGFAGRKVVVRTLDVGADKPLPFVEPGPGENPALGLRGWRLIANNPGLIERQLAAIAVAAAAAPCEVWVMAPMIATITEAEDFVALARGAGIATVGVMVEVPALALQAERLVEVVDFVSLGTNDLSQYTFAADRLVGELGELLDPWQPPVLELIARTASAGRAAGVPVGVCGEAASDPNLALVLTGFGCTSLSMSPNAVAEVRTGLATVTLERCQELATRALAAADGRDARNLVLAGLSG
ncbi:MAG: phosphoenolpyruvate--protein phosphotransferase [Nitriliruptor sp.]|nr:MAG: phosphoenolpyruvate--protein phosphotransferase [Nitriliruptor sp.]